MTFQEILTAAESEQSLKNAQDASTDDVRKTALLSYFTSFLPFLKLVNDSYKFKGLPFFAGEKTFNSLKNALESQINNKITCGFEKELRKDSVLKIRFFNDVTVGTFIRIQLTTQFHTKSEDFPDQEQAAAYLASIVVKYKD